MAITWGAWKYNGGNGMRVGIDATSTGVSTSSGSVTYTVYYYTENQYNYNDPQTLTLSGNISETISYHNGQSTGSGAIHRATRTYTYNYPANSYGSSPGTISFGATVGGAYNGVTPSHSRSYSLPARPYAAPNTPGTPTTARSSDAQATISWTLSATAQRPVSSVTLEMSTYSGAAWSAWASIATLSGAATSYTKTGLSSNRIYKFRAKANNGVGSSAYSGDSSYVYMTPAAPSSAAAAIVGEGAQIEVSWVDAAYRSTGTTFEIERSVNGGAWTSRATGLAQSSTVWIDTAPGAGENSYRVRAVNSSLASAWTSTNAVSTIVPPLAPTNLVPNETVVDADAPIIFSWRHNHGGDGAAQTAVRLQTSIDSGANWTTRLNGTAQSAQSWTMPAGTVANGQTVLWRVQTQGVSSKGFGPYSSTAVFTTSSTPTLAITAPGPEINTSTAVVEWTYVQSQGRPQTQYEVRILSSDGVLLESGEGSGAGTSWTSTLPLEDQGQYVVRVRARSSDGLWTEWVESSFAVSFLPPADVLLEAEFQSCVGRTQITMLASDPVEGESSPVERVDLYRRIDGGDWLLIVEGLQPVPGRALDIIDALPITRGLNEYGVVAYSSDSSTAITSIVSAIGNDGLEPDSGHWVFLSWGSGFSSTARFQGDPTVDATVERERGTAHFAGRARPVLLMGEHVGRTLSVSGTLYNPAVRCIEPDICEGDSDYTVWEAASHEAGIVCYRDWRGRRLFARLGSLSTSYAVGPIVALSFDLEQVEYRERAAAVQEPIQEGLVL